MAKLIVLAYKAARRGWGAFLNSVDKLRTLFVFSGNGVRHGSFGTTGVPYVSVARDGAMEIGDGFRMNNGVRGNPIGCYERCTFVVDRGCHLSIGRGVGLSQCALVAHADLRIGDNVKMGGGKLCLYH